MCCYRISVVQALRQSLAQYNLSHFGFVYAKKYGINTECQLNSLCDQDWQFLLDSAWREENYSFAASKYHPINST